MYDLFDPVLLPLVFGQGYIPEQFCCMCAASVDVDRIAREMDFQALQANIMNITFCNVASEVKINMFMYMYNTKLASYPGRRKSSLVPNRLLFATPYITYRITCAIVLRSNGTETLLGIVCTCKIQPESIFSRPLLPS